MKARGILAAGNWKMNHSPRETRAFFAELKTAMQGSALLASLPSDVQQIFFVPALSIEAAVSTASCAIGGQNVYWEQSGAFTGETSPRALADAGAGWCLVGHSERRSLFGETDEQISRKIAACASTGIKTLLCIGETRAEREAGQTRARIESQLAAVASAPQAAGMISAIAYEPIWAIGTGLTASPAQAQEVHTWIREWLWKHWGVDAGNRLPLLYGGSVTPQTVQELLTLSQVDGVLVGGASLKPAMWIQILEHAVTVAKAR